jgi:exonuclease VII large subunit
VAPYAQTSECLTKNLNEANAALSDLRAQYDAATNKIMARDSEIFKLQDKLKVKERVIASLHERFKESFEEQLAAKVQEHMQAEGALKRKLDEEKKHIEYRLSIAQESLKRVEYDLECERDRNRHCNFSEGVNRNKDSFVAELRYVFTWVDEELKRLIGEIDRAMGGGLMGRTTVKDHIVIAASLVSSGQSTTFQCELQAWQTNRNKFRHEVGAMEELVDEVALPNICRNLAGHLKTLRMETPVEKLREAGEDFLQ